MYEVEYILNKRINPTTKGIEYEVKWTGYSQKQTTWEPEKNLIFVKNLIDDFNERSVYEREAQQNDAKDQANGIMEREIEGAIVKKPTNIYNSLKIDSDDDDQFESKMRCQIYSDEDSPSQFMKVKSKFQDEKFKIECKNENIENQQPFEEFDSKVQQVQSQFGKIRRKKKIEKKERLELKVKSEKQKINLNGIVKKIQPIKKSLATHQLKYIDPKSLGYRAPSIFPSYRIEENEDDYYALHKERKEKQVDPRYSKYDNNGIIKPRRFPEKALYDGFDADFQSFPPPYSLPNQYDQAKELPSYNLNYDANQEGGFSYYQSEFAGFGNNESGFVNGGYNNGDIVVYEIKRMEKEKKGLSYLAQTNQGEIWLKRHEIVPRFSTELCEFYEKNLIFTD